MLRFGTVPILSGHPLSTRTRELFSLPSYAKIFLLNSDFCRFMICNMS